MTHRIRVLVVDDSAFARKVVRETLEADPGFDVVDIARDGLEALEKISTLKPDVVTLDLVMPNLDGLGVLKTLPLGVGAPRVVVVSIADEDSALGIAALQAGATDIVHKPTAQATSRLYELGEELRAKVRAAAAARIQSVPAGAAVVARVAAAPHRRIVVVGASTGGPQAVTRLLRALPADFPVPVAIVLHMPVGYTSAFAQRLDEDCQLDVVEATEGLVLRPGLAVIARAGIHLGVEPMDEVLRARLTMEPGSALHRPSVDVLFDSVKSLGAEALGVVLTGMGDDGAAGSRALVDAGGTVLTEAESSCVVYGMPRAVREAGASAAEAPIDAMADLILRHL